MTIETAPTTEAGPRVEAEPAIGAEAEPEPGGTGVPRELWILAGLLGVLMAFDNLRPLYGIGSLYLACPAVPLLLYLGVRLPPSRLRAEAVVTWCALGLLAVSLVVTGIGIVLDAGHLGEQVGGKPVPFKAITTLILVGTYVWAVRVGLRLAALDLRLLRLTGSTLLVTSLTGLLADLAGLIPRADPSWAHAFAWETQRPRGFNWEASNLGTALLCSTALLAFGRSTRRALLVLVPVTLGLCWLSGSRGALAAVGLGLVLGLAAAGLARVFSTLGAVVAGAVVALTGWTMSFAGQLAVGSGLWASLPRNLGSDGVRTGWGWVALQGLERRPWGYGWIDYWHDVPRLLATAAPHIVTQFGANVLPELEELVFGAGDSGLSPKTMPAFWALYLGVPGVLAVLALCVAAVVMSARSTSSRGAVLGVGMVVITLFSFSPGVYVYETALVLGAALSLSRAGTVPPPQP